MQMQETYTYAQVVTLRDCQVLYQNKEWRGGRKFLKRSKRSATVLFETVYREWVPVNYPASDVRVDGIRLEFIDKWSFTNPNSPFKSNYVNFRLFDSISNEYFVNDALALEFGLSQVPVLQFSTEKEAKDCALKYKTACIQVHRFEGNEFIEIIL